MDRIALYLGVVESLYLSYNTLSLSPLDSHPVHHLRASLGAR